MPGQAARTNARAVALAGLLFVAMTGMGCRSPEREAGFSPSAQNRVLVEEATTRANAILGAESPLHFQPSWMAPSGACGEAVPIYLIAPASNKPPSVAFVLQGGRHVFIDDTAVAELGSVQLDANPAASLGIGPGGMSDMMAAQKLVAEGRWRIGTAEALSFVLLHEAGHLLNGDAGLASPSPLGEATKPTAEVTRTMNAMKEREIAADRHALEALRRALGEAQDSHRNQYAAAILDTLRVTRLNLSARAARWRRGGADDLFAQLSFGDAQLTHPNLEYRIALIVYALDPNPGNRSAVRRILDHRRQRWSLTRHTVDPNSAIKRKIEADLDAQLDRDMRVLDAQLGVEPLEANPGVAPSIP